MSWKFWIRRTPSDDERRRAEALVEVEKRGMMGGREPELRIQHIPRRRRSIEEQFITYDPPNENEQ
jgi:hypothetical protein